MYCTQCTVYYSSCIHPTYYTHFVYIQVVNVAEKGRGIVATKPFSKGDFICEYSGDLTSEDKAMSREAEYQKDCLIGCYMYYFMYNGKKYW